LTIGCTSANYGTSTNYSSSTAGLMMELALTIQKYVFMIVGHVYRH
jgi:hypothetical protein